MPLYQKLHEKYADRGLVIAMISVDFAGSGEIQNLVDQLGLTIPVYWGGETVMWAYDVSLVPLKLIVRDGAIAERIVGLSMEAELDQMVQRLEADCPR